MAYYVINDDGSRYGPADIPLLRQWASESRLDATTVLEAEDTGQRTEASQIAELGLPVDVAPMQKSTSPAQTCSEEAGLSDSAYAFAPLATAWRRVNCLRGWGKTLAVIGIFIALACVWPYLLIYALWRYATRPRGKGHR